MSSSRVAKRWFDSSAFQGGGKKKKSPGWEKGSLVWQRNTWKPKINVWGQPRGALVTRVPLTWGAVKGSWPSWRDARAEPVLIPVGHCSNRNPFCTARLRQATSAHCCSRFSTGWMNPAGFSSRKAEAAAAEGMQTSSTFLSWARELTAWSQHRASPIASNATHFSWTPRLSFFDKNLQFSKNQRQLALSSAMTLVSPRTAAQCSRWSPLTRGAITMSRVRPPTQAYAGNRHCHAGPGSLGPQLPRPQRCDKHKLRSRVHSGWAAASLSARQLCGAAAPSCRPEGACS